MKNKKFLSMVLVVAMMLMGAGYAAWSQSFTVNATVATGNLTLEIQNLMENECSDYDECYMSGTQKLVNDTIEVTVTDLYPGASYGIAFDVVNVGTIGAKLDYEATINSMDLGGLDHGEIYEEDGYRKVELSNGLILCLGEKYLEANCNCFKSHVINPESTLKVELGVIMPCEIEDLEDEEYTFTISPMFVQFNAPCEDDCNCDNCDSDL